MKFRWAILAAALLFAAPAGRWGANAQEKTKSAEARVERFRLSNGLTVLVRRDARLSLVNVTCLYKVGAANEAPGITGIAHFIEHMAYRATENVSAADITGTFERLGGRWNGYTELDQTVFAETIPAWALESALRIESERMARAKFDPQEFDRERTSVIAELQSYENDPASILWDLAVTTSYETHPYRMNTIGYLSDVRSITRDEAYRFYKDYYGPNNAVLAIAGDVEPAAALALVEKYLGGLAPAPRSPAVRIIEPPQRGEKRVVLIYPGTQQHLAWVFRAPAGTDVDFPKLVLLDALLAGGAHELPIGGGEALPGSRLERAVAAAGGSGVQTALRVSRMPHIYGFSVKAPTGASIEKIEAALQGELSRIEKEGVPEANLGEARRRLAAAAALEVETLYDSAHRLAYFEALGSWELRIQIEQAAKSVTSAELRVFVRKWFDPRRRTVAIYRIGPADEEKEDAALPPRPAPGREVRPSPVPETALRPLAAPALATARKKLANGVVIRAARREGPAATVIVRLGWGSARDAGIKPGTALLAARVLQKRIEERGRLDQLGARLSSTAADFTEHFSTLDAFDLEVRAPAESLGDVLDLVGGAFSATGVDPGETEHALEELREEVAGLSDDATWQAREAALSAGLIGWRPAYGSPTALRELTAADAKNFLAAHLLGGAVTVGIAAPWEPAAIIARAEKGFGGMRRGRLPALLPLPAKPKAELRAEIPRPLEGKTRAEVVFAGQGPSKGDPDALPLRLANYIVGETGYSGRLGRALVHTGLTYSVYSRVESSPSGSLVEITTGTAPADLEKTLDAIRRELGGLKEKGIEDWELREAQSYSLGRMVFALETDSRIAHLLVDAETTDEDLLDFPSRSAKILAVTRADVERAARRYFDPETFRFGLAGALPARDAPR